MQSWFSRYLTAAVLAAMLVARPAAAAAPLCSAQSGAQTVALVELYTSEGCDSCPPADRWLRTLPRDGVTPEQAVALSLHVDYWDYIGWKDPYAKPLFSARQQEANALIHSSVVYTPQVMLAGRDFRGWSKGGLAAELKRINAQPARADIMLELRDAGAGRIEFGASALAKRAEDRADAVLVLATYENGLSGAVHAGENKGATLRHDHVARTWSGPVALDAAGRASVSLGAAPGAADRGKTGAVAFVQNRKTGEVLQALALPYCRG
jgi:hypothetical protein